MNQKLSIIIILLSLCTTNLVEGQDLNTISGSGFNIATGYPAQNGPENTVTMGIQNHYDANYKWQLVNAHGSNNYYLRSYVYGWGSYYKLWHTGNLNREDIDFRAKSIVSNNLNIKVPGSSSPIQAMNLDVESFGTPENASNSYFLRIRDIGANSVLFTINGYGNVLINKPSQSNLTYKLDVAGKIRADEIVINTTGADFVFEPTYKLRSLSELETFIRTNKHLPDIAPAKEMQENGVSAGEMQAKLLQKVEELTLYVIEKDKEIARQQLVLLELIKEINKLKHNKSHE